MLFLLIVMRDDDDDDDVVRWNGTCSELISREPTARFYTIDCWPLFTHEINEETTVTRINNNSEDDNNKSKRC